MGYSLDSIETTVRVAAKPDVPTLVSTTINGDYVLISWTAPYDGGSSLLSYDIQILKRDGVTFSADLVDCNGSDAIILSATECNVQITTLRNSPYDHPWGASIEVKVSATNIVGTSDFSTVENGAILLTYPDAPQNLADDTLVTSMYQIGLAWYAGANDGGTPVIDYRIWYAE